MVEGKVGPPKRWKESGGGGGVSGGVDKRKAEEKGIAPIPSRYVGITRFLYHWIIGNNTIKLLSTKHQSKLNMKIRILEEWSGHCHMWVLILVSKTRVGVACKTRLRREYITTILDKLERFVGREKFGSFFCLFVYKSLYPPLLYS